MTDQELKELREKYDNCTEKRNQLRNNLTACDVEVEALHDAIVKEEAERFSKSVEQDNLKNLILGFFDKVSSHTKTTGELWMVKINGHTFRSEKGKYTWTSRTRAINAVVNYLDYFSYTAFGDLSRKIRFTSIVNDAVENLVADGHIELVRVF